jgi:hypothetical protein
VRGNAKVGTKRKSSSVDAAAAAIEQELMSKASDPVPAIAQAGRATRRSSSAAEPPVGAARSRRDSRATAAAMLINSEMNAEVCLMIKGAHLINITHGWTTPFC